jgi:transcriptional regulator of acetoin/glycerol metabolism
VREVVSLRDLPPELQRARLAGSKCPPSAEGDEDPLKLRLMNVIARAQTMAEAARTLGVNRSTLYRQLERFGLRPSRGVRQA